MVRDQWTETCASPDCLCLRLSGVADVTDFKMWQSYRAGVKQFVSVHIGVFNHDASMFKAAGYLFSWSEEGVSPVRLFSEFHTLLTVWLWKLWDCIQNMLQAAFK